MAEQYRWFVGIDWATASHEICVLDAGGHTIDRRTVEHTGAGIAEFVGYLQELAAGAPSNSVDCFRFSSQRMLSLASTLDA